MENFSFDSRWFSKILYQENNIIIIENTKGGIIVNAKSFAIGLILGLVLILGLAFLALYDWIAVIVAMIVFFAIKERLNLDAPSFWYGEIIAILVIDLWVFIIVMGIPAYAENIIYIIINFLPALLISVVALMYFGRKQRQIRS